MARINSTVRTFNTLPCAARARASFENSLATPLLCVRRSRSRLHLAAGILSSHSRVTDIPPVHSLLSCLLPVAVALRRANAFLNLSLSPESVESLALSRSPIRSLARTLADLQSTGVGAGMPNVGLWVYIDLRVCTRAGATTETAQVKVAESAGQHESTGNVSRELGVGVTAASV